MAVGAGDSGLIGRDRDVRAIAGLATQSRLITLLGPGGVGKTRLAIEVAGELETDFDRVEFVDLTAQDDAGPFHVDVDLSVIDISASLLVFDNCEHVVEEAAAWLTALLATTSAIVVATSRRPLGIAGERLYPVRPLSVPPDGTPPWELLAYEAVQLFIERAAQTDPTFELTNANADAVSAICRLSGGLPIALELAAGLVASRTMSSIVGAMAGAGVLALPMARRDIHPHQQSLARSVEWSLALLDDAELRLLDCAAAFRGSFDTDTLESIHSALNGTETQPILDRLVRNGLISFDRSTGRYTVLNFIATTVRAATDEAMAAALLAAHGEWALDRASTIASLASDPDPDGVFAGFHLDIRDLTHAADRFYDEGRPDDWLAVVGPIAQWWVHQGGPVDIGRWESTATSANPPTLESVSVTVGLAFHLGHSAEYERSKACANVALAQSELLGEVTLSVGALTAIGNAELSLGFRESAAATYLRALAAVDEVRDGYLHSIVLICQARAAASDVERRDRLSEAIAISSGSFPALYVVAMQHLARLEMREGNLSLAAELAATSSHVATRLGYDEALATAHNTDGLIASRNSDLSAAEVAHRAAIAVGQRIGHSEIVAEGLIGLADVCVALRDVSTAAELVGHARRLASNSVLPETLARFGADLDSGIASLTIRESLAKMNTVEPIGVDSSDSESLLTSRERAVLLLLRGDLTQREIADELYVSVSTVRSHVKSIYKKLGVHNRTSCVHVATTLGLLPPP